MPVEWLSRVDLIWDQRVEANVETTDPPAVDGEEEHLQQPRRRFYQDNRSICDDLRVSSTLARLRMSQHLISQQIGTFYMQHYATKSIGSVSVSL